MESIRRLLASLMSLSRGRLINPVAAKISCALIALAVLQRANEVRLAVSVGKEVPTAWLAFVVTTLALGTLLHVWRGSLLAHMLALLLVTASCGRSMVGISADSDDDPITISFGQSYRATEFVFIAIVWLAVLIAVALAQRRKEELAVGSQSISS